MIALFDASKRGQAKEATCGGKEDRGVVAEANAGVWEVASLRTAHSASLILPE